MFRRHLAVDLVIGVTLITLWLLLYETHQLPSAIAMCTGLFVLRVATWVGYLAWATAAIERERRRGPEDPAALRALQSRLRALPLGVMRVFIVAWSSYFAGLTALAWWVAPDIVEIGRAELLGAALQTVSVGAGASVIYLVLTEVMVDRSIAELATKLRDDEFGQRDRREPLRHRLIFVGVTLTCVPAVWYASMNWLDEVQMRRATTVAELRGELEHSLRVGARGDPPALAIERVDILPPGFESAAFDDQTWVRVDTRQERAAVAIATPDGRWARVEREVEFGWTTFFVEFALLLFVASVWGSIAIATQAEGLLRTLGRLSEVTRRMVAVGDLREIPPIAIVANNEVGDVSRDFNVMLGTFSELATAAERVAEGDLSIDIAGRGDLPEAFARMVAQLHELVARVRETTTNLASATSEILAATTEQERASSRQTEEMRELDQGMAALASSATEVDEASHDVLANAERTLANADETTTKIGSLGQQIAGIEALLGQIREIADRSDLLALNGSLEATRAGEAGRGFALVATEMRRLAERVTGIVDDVRELLAAINLANHSTVETTERSRALAEETAAAARSIASRTQDQSGETERASVNVREVAEILARTSAAMSQTRAIAEDLGGEARHLEQLLASFVLRERD